MNTNCKCLIIGGVDGTRTRDPRRDRPLYFSIFNNNLGSLFPKNTPSLNRVGIRGRLAILGNYTLLLIVFALAGCAPYVPTPPKAQVIGIIGNSKACGYRQTGWELLVEGGPNIDATGLLTQAGEDNPSIMGWAQNLERWMRSTNPNSIVYNMAGSGWTSRDHLQRGTVQKLIAMSPKPTMVFIQLVVNDRLKDQVEIADGITFAEFVANTTQMIAELRAAGIVPVLVKEDNEALTAGAGIPWAEYSGMGGVVTGTNNNTHIAYADYINQYDVIGRQMGVTVLDAYTPTLNTGQDPQYVYEGIPAPLDFRYSLMHGMIGVGLNDVWHQNDAGGAIILQVYQNYLSGSH